MKVSHLTDEELQAKLDELRDRLDEAFYGERKRDETHWHVQGLIDIVHEEMDRREGGG